MNNFRKKCMDFIYKNWKNEYNEPDFVVDSPEFEKIAEKAFQGLIKDKPKNGGDNKFVIKLGGQSGSGKTTQLLPAIKNNLDAMRVEYIHIAVRVFAKYHPHFDELLERFGKENIREKTNGFALTLLVRVCEKLICGNYNIFYEVTLLEPVFEEYLIHLFKKNNYNIIYNILSIPFELSNKWIIERENDLNSKEAKRKVLKSSSDYFYNILPLAINKIIDNKNILSENDYCVIWNGFNKKPLKISNIFDKSLYNVFINNREIIKKSIYNENDLLEAKTKFYKVFFKKINI